MTLRMGVIALSLVVASCGGATTSQTGPTSQPSHGTGALAPDFSDRRPSHGSGALAPDFSARSVDGKTVRLGTHLGKDVILLSFWQTWCEPCIAEFPHLRRMYDANKDKGFVVFGVAMDGPETVANVQAFTQRNQLNFKVLLDEDSHVAAIYNPKKSAPLSILIDRSGKIAVIREGYNPGDEVYLGEDVDKALSAQP